MLTAFLLPFLLNPVSSALVAQNTISPQESLALHLRSLNVRMYGAFWCPACTRQREIFGDRAFRHINYIECDPRGENAQPQICRAEGIRAYPTWAIGGRKIEGVLSISQLAELSGQRALSRIEQAR